MHGRHGAKRRARTFGVLAAALLATVLAACSTTPAVDDAPVVSPDAARDAEPAPALDADAGAAATDGAGSHRPTLTCPAATPAPAGGVHTTKVPAEFLARSYVEAFGRIPDQAGWNANVERFRTTGCSPASLSAITGAFFKSSEFLALPYTDAQRLLALVRGALGREPTENERARFAPILAADPAAWCSVVDQVIAMPEYAWLAESVCDPSVANYHREAAFPALAVAGTMTQAALQAQLDAAPRGKTVMVPESTLVHVTSSLVIPPGVTLATAGLSGRDARLGYARMARIVRAAPFDAPVVTVRPGGGLHHMWIDGRRLEWPTVRTPDGQNVFVDASGTDQSLVAWNRTDNPLGPQNVRFGGSNVTGSCAANNTARENLVNNFSNDNRLPGGIWSDGIFTICERSTIEGNEVIDASDVTLIAFFSLNGSPQESKIVNNSVLSAGNDAFGGLGTDPWAGQNGSCKGVCSFVGTVFDHNTLWSGPNTHYVFGIAAGTRAWSFIPMHGEGTGATWTQNTSGSSRARVQVATYVSGMLDAHLAGNWDGAMLDFVGASTNGCGIGATLANPAYSSGALQGAVSANLDNCL